MVVVGGFASRGALLQRVGGKGNRTFRFLFGDCCPQLQKCTTHFIASRRTIESVVRRDFLEF